MTPILTIVLKRLMIVLLTLWVVTVSADRGGLGHDGRALQRVGV